MSSFQMRFDQYLSGNATKVSVEVSGDIIRVTDDGPGLPFDKPSPSDDCSNLAEYYFLHSHDSATADNHAPHVHIIGIGLGLAVVNSVAEWIKVSSSNGACEYRQEFGMGKVISPSVLLQSQSASGTSVEMKLDGDFFFWHKPELSGLRKKLFELSHFYPRLIVEFQQERYLSPRGLLDLAYMQYPDPQSSWGHRLPDKFFLEQVKDGVQIQVATLGKTESATSFKSWVNGVESVEGGSHIAGLHKALENQNWKPELAFIHVIMHDPRYAGPTKDSLCSPHVQDVVEELVTESLIAFKSNIA